MHVLYVDKVVTEMKNIRNVTVLIQEKVASLALHSRVK